MIRVILLVLAAICFALLLFKVAIGTLPLLAAGLFCWVLGELLAGVGPGVPTRRV